MSKTFKIPDGFITLVETSFNCPICECPHTENDWYDSYNKAKTIVIYKKCKGCRKKLGITIDMTGDVVVWNKATETKN